MNLTQTIAARTSKDMMSLITSVRDGIKYASFENIADEIPFSIHDWSHYLHLNERTFQRYKKEKKVFDPIHSEKILEISMFYNKGVEVFGDKNKFDVWLGSVNVALGNTKPKDLLDNSFGINMLNDELIRIENGILA